MGTSCSFSKSPFAVFQIIVIGREGVVGEE